MTRKVPAPRYTPKAGYRSTTEAVLVLSGRGLKPTEVAAVVQTTVETVRGIIQRDRKARRDKLAKKLSDGQQRALKQAYVEYLHQVAAKMGSDIDTLHKLFRFCHINNYQITAQKAKEPALPPEQKVDEAEPARAGLVDTPKPEPLDLTATTPPRVGSATRKDAGPAAQAPETVISASEPKPMMVMKLDKRPMDLTNASRFYTLRREGMYLNLDGSGFTDVRRHAYRATLPQARKMRLVNAVAMGCSLSPFELSKK